MLMLFYNVVSPMKDKGSNFLDFSKASRNAHCGLALGSLFERCIFVGEDIERVRSVPKK